MAEYKKVSLSHHPRPLSEESRYSSREGTPTGWASLREVLFALGPLGPEVGMWVRTAPMWNATCEAPRERFRRLGIVTLHSKVSDPSRSSPNAPLYCPLLSCSRRQDPEGNLLILLLRLRSGTYAAIVQRSCL